MEANVDDGYQQLANKVLLLSALKATVTTKPTLVLVKMLNLGNVCATHVFKRHIYLIWSDLFKGLVWSFLFSLVLWAILECIILFESVESPHAKHPSLKNVSTSCKQMSCSRSVCSVDGWKVYIDDRLQTAGCIWPLCCVSVFHMAMAVQSFTFILNF